MRKNRGPAASLPWCPACWPGSATRWSRMPGTGNSACTEKLVHRACQSLNNYLKTDTWLSIPRFGQGRICCRPGTAKRSGRRLPKRKGCRCGATKPGCRGESAPGFAECGRKKTGMFGIPVFLQRRVEIMRLRATLSVRMEGCRRVSGNPPQCRYRCAASASRAGCCCRRG